MFGFHDYNAKPIHNINPITEITHSPLYPMVLLTLYLFAIGFTIGNYAGYFRFNTETYGDNFVRAYLAFTVLGSAAYFLVAGVAWLWAARYVTNVDSRIRKLTFGFIAIFLLHDLPCFSMELHAIMTKGWRNGYQGFVFVVQIITFLLSFTNGWLYYTWVMAEWCQYWYGWPHDSFGLKTGQEQLSILPPMSPAERQEMVSTPMLGSGLRWNSNGNSPSAAAQQQQQQQQRELSIGSGQRRASLGNINNNNSGGGLRRQNSGSRFVTPRNNEDEYYRNNNPNSKLDDDILFSSGQQQQRSAPNSGLRRQNPPDAFGPPSNNNNNNNYNFREQNSFRDSTLFSNNNGGSGIRPVNFIDGLEDNNNNYNNNNSNSLGGVVDQQQQVLPPSSSTRSSSSLAFPQLQPVSLMTSPAMSRLRTSTSGNYVPVSPSKNGGNGILKLESLRSPGIQSNSNSTSNSNNDYSYQQQPQQSWRDNLPVVTSGAGPNGSNVLWTNNRKGML